MRILSFLVLPLAITTVLAASQRTPPSSAEIRNRMEAMNSGPGKQAFIETLKGRMVTLKEPLYSVIDSDPTNPNIRFGEPGTRSVARGLTVVSPDKGTFYRDEYGSFATTVDRDPERLVAKIGSTMIKLLTYKPPSVLTVRGIQFGSGPGLPKQDDQPSRIVLALVDELEPAKVATTLTVQWPAPFSGEFVERTEVENLISAMLGAK